MRSFLSALLFVVATLVVACPSPKSADGAAVCACSLCEPIVSDDGCTTDADCAPSVPCHAPACIAQAKAQRPVGGQICTEEMQCATVDANACLCVKGRCTLAPRSGR